MAKNGPVGWNGLNNQYTDLRNVISLYNKDGTPIDGKVIIEQVDCVYSYVSSRVV